MPLENQQPEKTEPTRGQIDPAAPEGPPKSDGLSSMERREAALESIIDFRRGIIRDNLRQAGITEDPFAEEGAAAPSAPAQPVASGNTPESAGAERGEPGGGQEPAPAAKPTAAPADAGEPRTVRVKIDGVEQEVTVDELVRNYQTDRAATQRLDAANRMLETVTRMQEGLNAPPAGDGKTPDTAPKPGAAAPDAGAPRPEIKELAKVLAYGEVAEVEKALEKVLQPASSSKGASIDIDAIQPALEARIRSSLEWTGAVERFGREFKDIATDPRLSSIAGQTANAMMREAQALARDKQIPMRPYYEYFEAAGKATQEWAAKMAESMGFQKAPDPAPDPNGQDPNPVTNRSNGNGAAINVDTNRRVEVKRSATQLPAGRATPRTAPAAISADPADRVASASSAIQEIRRARHQA